MKKPQLRGSLLNRLTDGAATVNLGLRFTRCLYDIPIKPHLAIASVNSCKLMDFDECQFRWSQFRKAERKRKCDLIPLQDGGKTGFKTRVRFATVNSDWGPARLETVPDNNQSAATGRYWLNSLN